MKKFISLFLTMLVLVSVFASFTVSAAVTEVPTKNYFLSGVGNFLKSPSETKNLWRAVVPGSYRFGATQTYKDFQAWLPKSLNSKPILNAQNKNSKPLPAYLYIDTPGEYSVFVLMAQFKEGVDHFTPRPVKVNIGTWSSEYGRLETSDYSWEKGATNAPLVEGFNEVYLENIANNGEINILGLFITNDTSLTADDLCFKPSEPSAIVEGKLNVALDSYRDFDAPTFATDTKIRMTSETAAEITLPKVTDAKSGVAEYKVSINDAEAEVLTIPAEGDIKKTVENLTSNTIKVKVEATDVFGNATVYTTEGTDENGFTTYTTDKVLIDEFEIAKVVEGESDTYTTAAALADFGETDKIGVTLNVTNTWFTEQNLRLSVAVYNKATGSMVAGTATKTTLAVASDATTVQLKIAKPEGFNTTDYEIKAHLWDAATYSPMAEAKVISE